MNQENLETSEMLEKIETEALENTNEVAPLEIGEQVVDAVEKSEASGVEFSSCPCMGGCGSNYSVVSGCPCMGSCGSNYHK